MKRIKQLFFLIFLVISVTFGVFFSACNGGGLDNSVEGENEMLEVIFEAENGIIDNGSIATTGKVYPYCSGSSFVYGLKAGGTINIRVTAMKETTASLRFVLSSYEGSGEEAIPLKLKDYLTMCFNGVEIQLSDSDVLPGGADDDRGPYSRYANWYEVSLDNVRLNKGYNSFVVTSKVDMTDANDMHSTVFDCLRVLYTEEDAVPNDLLKAPLSVDYVLENETNGRADGTLYITLPVLHNAQDVYMWWADENGKLEGYTALARFKVNSMETTEIVHKMTPNTLIPEGATKLLVYTYNDLQGLSKDCFEVSLPNTVETGGFGEVISEFQIVGDIHVQGSANSSYNPNFIAMLNDIVKNSPDTLGIMTVGDNVDRYFDDCWDMFDSLYNSVENAPPMYIGVGNHEYMHYSGHAENLYEENLAKYLERVTLPNGVKPNKPWFDFWLNGYHYVYLGSETATQKATLSDAQLQWLDETLAEKRDGRPIFLMLHQAMINTVSGSSTSEGWGDVKDPEKLKAVLDKYPEVLMFNGHSHWILNSENCMYDGNGETATIFNTSSVGYLWHSYYKPTGEKQDGSEGYYVRIYKDKVLVLGRDFITGKWISSAQFVVNIATPETTHVHTEQVIEGKVATCNENGLTNGIKCSTCGMILQAQYTISALGHDWREEIIKTPVDDTGGEKLLICDRQECGQTMTERIFQAEYAELNGCKKWSGDEMSEYSYLGNGYVYGFSKNGTLTIKWTSSVATMATLRFVMSSYENKSDTETLSLQINEYLSFSFNGQTIAVPDSAVLTGGPDYDVDGDGNVDKKSRYARWYELVIENVQIREGENTFVVTCNVDMANSSDTHSTLFDCLCVFYEKKRVL